MLIIQSDLIHTQNTNNYKSTTIYTHKKFNSTYLFIEIKKKKDDDDDDADSLPDFLLFLFKLVYICI